MSLPVSIGLFMLAGLCEIGGGYLVWLSLRGGKPLWSALNRRHDSHPLWHYPHLAACAFRTGVRGIWWSVYRPVATLGVESGCDSS